MAAGDLKKRKLDHFIKSGDIKLERGEVISKDTMTNIPGPYPVYSSSVENNGLFGQYGRFMFDEELITWSVDGGGDFFYRPKHKFSVTNVSGILRLNTDKFSYRYLYYLLDWEHKKYKFDYVEKAHPSVIRKLYDVFDIGKNEQLKIAEVLTTVDEAIEKTHALIEKNKRVKQGLMQDLFRYGIDERGQIRSEKTHKFKDSPFGCIPMEWDIDTIGNTFDVQLGKMLSKKAKRGLSPYPYLANKNVQWENVDLSELETMDFSDFEREKYHLDLNDVLICEGGEVGRTAIWRGELEDCYFQKAIHRLRPRKNNKVKAWFLLYFMRYAASIGFFTNLVSQTSIAHLTREKLMEMKVTVPNPEEQERIIDALSGVTMVINNEDNYKQKLLTLKRGLMEDLLSGTVRVNHLIKE